VQLVPVIKEFFASEQCKTGRPVPGTIPENPPYQIDCKLKVENPFNLKDWLKTYQTEIHQNGKKYLFDEAKYKSDVIIYGRGVDNFKPIQHEIWLWQLVKIHRTQLNFSYLRNVYVISTGR
jgi:3-hydroxyanthranilate 3,4-dioxygenase